MRTVTTSLIGLTLLVTGHVLLRFMGAYALWPHLDVLMHAAGGGLLAMGLAALVRLSSDDRGCSRPLRLLFVLGGVLVGALAWECTEMIARLPSEGHLVRTAEDAPKDILCGLLGAALWLFGDPSPEQRSGASRRSECVWIANREHERKAQTWLCTTQLQRK